MKQILPSMYVNEHFSRLHLTSDEKTESSDTFIVVVHPISELRFRLGYA